jgi:alpha-amylase
MQDKGSVLIKEKDVNKHRNFEKLLFDRTDGDW